MSGIHVREERDELLYLLHQYEGTECALRCRMLLRFIDSPEASVRSIAADLDLPESTLRRWKNIYLKMGLSGLLEFKGRKRQQSKLSCSQTLITTDDHTTQENPFAVSMYEFLNTFPTAYSPMEWSRLMQNHLVRSFKEVDYALVCISLISSQHHREESSNQYQHIGFEDPLTGHVLFKGRITSMRTENPHWKNIIEDFHHVVGTQIREKGSSLTRTGQPAGFDYFIQDDDAETYLGSIILLHDVQRGKFPPSVLSIMNALYPFFRNQFLTHVSAFTARKPRTLSLQNVIEEISADLRLTKRENDMVSLLLRGHSYREIADALCISYQTVTSHVSRIYRKAGVSRLTELFANFV